LKAELSSSAFVVFGGVPTALLLLSLGAGRNGTWFGLRKFADQRAEFVFADLVPKASRTSAILI
jgi:hypothetical protein